MHLTGNVGLRVSVFLGLVGMLFLGGCASKDGLTESSEVKTRVKAEATANEEYSDDSYVFTMKEQNKVVGETGYFINLNQIGYRGRDTKIAVVSNNSGVNTYQVLDGLGNTVYSGTLYGDHKDTTSDATIQYADFSMFKKPGSYYIICGDELFSDEFIIGDDVYHDYYSALGTYFSDVQNKYKKMDDPDNDAKVMVDIYGTEEQLEVSGGWYDLKERGQYTVDSATTIASMLLLYDTYNNIELEDNDWKSLNPEKLLDLIKEELQWLLKLQRKDGAVYHKVTASGDASKLGAVMAYPVSTCATADFAAVMAKAYRYYVSSDYEFANTCLVAAQRAWIYLQNHSDNEAFINPYGVTTSEYKDDDSDERFWAAVELSLTTKRSDYVTYVSEHLASQSHFEFTWQKVAGYGILDAIMKGKEIFSTETYNRMIDSLEKSISSIMNHVDTKNYQLTMDSKATFQTIVGEGITLYVMGEFWNNRKYIKGAEVYLDYLMGANSNSENYIGEANQLESLNLDYVSKIAILIVGINEQ